MKHASLGSFIVVAALAAFASSCSQQEAVAASDVEKPAAQASAVPGTLPQLVFFINPNGAPCQIQDRILRDMAAELQPKVRLVYYRTTVGADLDKFRQYGIRALPTLVLTDPTGKELRRTTPGVQSADQVRRLIAP